MGGDVGKTFGNIIEGGVKVTKAVGDIATGNVLGAYENMKGAVKDASGLAEKERTEVGKANKVAEAANKAQTDAKKKYEENVAQGEASAEASKKTSRARTAQKSKSEGTGRRSTILTGKLGEVGGETGGRKNLLGL